MNFQLLTFNSAPFGHGMSLSFHFQLDNKDHLGNNRLSYTLDPETHQIKILEENHYYPFGLKHGNYNAIRKDVRYKEQAASKKEVKQVVPEAVKFKYLYNGKELQDELGLNWYDYGARNYQADLGRWFNIDPLAEKYCSLTTYQYTANNPIYFVDKDGKEIIKIEGGVKYTGIEAKAVFLSIKGAIEQNHSFNLKIHFVKESETPNIYKFTVFAISNGKPFILHYDKNLRRRRQRRRIATRGFTKIPGFSIDEYPYASTFEGGVNALATYVPEKENWVQGGILQMRLYKNLKQGEAFIVLPVPNPLAPKEPATRHLPKMPPPVFPVIKAPKIRFFEPLPILRSIMPTILISPPGIDYIIPHDILPSKNISS